MLSKRAKILLVTALIAGSLTGITWYLLSPKPLPDTLPKGQNPSLILPLSNLTYNDYIGGYGQVTPEFWHGGFDFGVNGTTRIVSPCNAYVKYVERNWFNEMGGHWQSNVDLHLNGEWEVRFAFESWTIDEGLGGIQGDAISVEVGQYIGAGGTLGSLLCHGSSAHLHFGLLHNGEEICIYPYFTDPAKIAFADQFARVGTTAAWCN